MDKVILARINSKEAFASDVRGEIRFKNNSVPRIQAKLDKLNQSVKCPKWSVQLEQHGDNYSIVLLKNIGVAAKILAQNTTKKISNRHVIYVDGDQQYSFTSFALREKLTTQKLKLADIETYLDKHCKKLKSGVRSLADNYSFIKETALFDHNEINAELENFSFA